MAHNQKRTQLLGIGIIVICLVAVAGVLLVIANQHGLLGGPRVTPDAMLYVDVPGRVALNKTLQVEGPAPIPVAAGKYTLTFFDISASPLEVTVPTGAFLYVPNPNQRYASPSATRGVVHAAAFPPNTQLEIPDCTPTDSSRAIKCQSGHALTAELSPGIYTVHYRNPHFSEYSEQVTASANSAVNVTHSFISTVAEWETWRAAHGAVLENHASYRRHYGVDDVFFVPFEAAGIVAAELFD